MTKETNTTIIIPEQNLSADDMSDVFSGICLTGNIALINYYMELINNNKNFSKSDINFILTDARISVAMNGKPKIMKELLEHSIFPVTKYAMSILLEVSAETGNLPVFELLVSEFKKMVKDYWNTLDIVFVSACEYGSFNIVKWMIDSGNVTMFSYQFDGYKQALINNHVEIAIYVNSQCTVNIGFSTTEYVSIFLKACANGRLSTVIYMLDKGFVELDEKLGCDALITACKQDHMQVAKYFVHKLGVVVDDMIYQAVTKGETDASDELIEWLKTQIK